IAKRLSPATAGRIEQTVKRWLPAVGLSDLGPPLAGSVADPNGACVWHVYHDLGPHELDPRHASGEAIQASVEQIARLHTRFASHALLGEVRLHGGDLGIHFFESNVRDALYALEAWPAGPSHEPLRQRLLRRLDPLRRELREPRHLARDRSRSGQGGVAGASSRRRGRMVSAIRTRPPASRTFAAGRLRW